MSKRQTPSGDDSTAESAPPVIQVVNAEPRILEMLKSLMDNSSRLFAHANPDEALSALSRETADIIIIDQEKPGKEGVKFLKEAQRIAPGCKKIVLTASDDPRLEFTALKKARIDMFLTKPVTREELLQAVETQWQNRRLEKERDLLHHQYEEMAQAQENMNVQFDERVKDRTSQLTQANKKLQKALEEIEKKNKALTLLNERLNVQATVDPLTGLFNRREFNRRLKEEWARFQRHARPLSLIMLDIDHFKRVNDDHGHECGDSVLQALGKLMRNRQRKHDVLSRFGGEEFIILLPETKLDAAFNVAESLRNRVRNHTFTCKASRLTVHISLGVSSAGDQGPVNEDDLIKLADLAMYRAKEDGRNRSVVVDGKNREKTLRSSA